MIRLRERQASCSDWRVGVVIFACLLAFAALLGGATWRGSFQGEMLVSESERRYNDVIPLNGERGVIWDRNGRILAASAVVYSAYINPTLYRRWAKQAGNEAAASVQERLVTDIGVTPERLEEILARGSGFAYLRHDLSPELQHRVSVLDLPHVGFEKRFRRFYPAAQEAAHVVGFTDNKGKGQEGIERYAEEWLAPQAGKMQVLRTSNGAVLELTQSQPAVDGKDLTVTIDTRLQYFAALAMSRIVAHHQATSASFILMDIHTGDILVMANVPTYNPNSGSSDVDQRRNRALQDSFEPGSVMKPILAAVAIEAGVVDTNTVLRTAKPIYYRGKTITDKKVKTNLNLSEVIMRSSNKGAVRVSELLRDEVMWEGFSRFGMGATLLGWPGENIGVLHDYRKWRPVEKATMAYGYFISGNLLQLVRAYAALGNGGLLPTPGIIVGDERAPSRRVISAQTSAKVLGMIENVVSIAGTAPKASISGYRVAGKTGTSHKRNKGVKGYDKSVYRSAFIGVAPVSNPRFVAGVVVDEPRRNGYYGGTVAAPIFAEVVGHALQLYSVLPDRLPERKEATGKVAALTKVAR